MRREMGESTLLAWGLEAAGGGLRKTATRAGHPDLQQQHQFDTYATYGPVPPPFELRPLMP